MIMLEVENVYEIHDFRKRGWRYEIKKIFKVMFVEENQ